MKLKNSIKLVPVDEDPIEGLKEALSGLRDVSKDEMEEAALDAAKEEVEDDLR
ncbi:hypothetical protein GLU60_04060 [Nanohaloarchaea archaeon H01]|nr:hypothetical protein [Nanohaloarchaea archaeon H01]